MLQIVIMSKNLTTIHHQKDKQGLINKKTTSITNAGSFFVDFYISTPSSISSVSSVVTTGGVVSACRPAANVRCSIAS